MTEIEAIEIMKSFVGVQCKIPIDGNAVAEALTLAFLALECHAENKTDVEGSFDWTKVPIDTPVLVKKEENDKWKKRYFAKYDVASKRVCTFRYGATSWSDTYGEFSKWNYAILASMELDGEDTGYNE
jgi:hypothetical protein